jgi:N-acetylglucosaminyl-diphospho-decaprenol L-rhamnosyltransferase
MNLNCSKKADIMCVDISFITVNYNTCALVQDILNFFKAASLPFSYSLVIVDNNSTDGSHELLNGRTDVVYIPAGENLGYGRAINRGVEAVDSRYVCAMNTDVILDEVTLVALWEFIEHTPDAGVAAPRITNRDGSTQGFMFHRSILSIVFNSMNKIRSSMLKRKLAHATAPMRVQGVMGAFFLIRRSCIPRGILFDVDFFFYFEDNDLAHRLLDAGVACYALPSHSLVHLGGSSTSLEGARVFYRSKNLYLRKHYGSLFADVIKTIDRFRLRMKFLKYSLLALISSSRRVAEKKAYYSAMRSASDF